MKEEHKTAKMSLILNQLLLLTCGNLYDFWRITSSFNSFEWTYNCREHIAWFAISQFVCLQRTVILTRSLIRLDLPKFLHIARTVTKFYLHLLWIRECEFYFWTNVKVLKFTTKHVESAIFRLKRVSTIGVFGALKINSTCYRNL